MDLHNLGALFVFIKYLLGKNIDKMILSQKVKALIEEKSAKARQLRRLVGSELGFEARTIKKWSEEGSPRLCSPAAVSAISKHTNIPESDILVQESQVA